jgi:outer membrane protein assembly factor BamD (BamD/ComL family)
MCDRRCPLARVVGLVKYTVIVLVCSLALVTSGCQGDRAEDLYQLATFEEQQNNRDHARQLYEEILQDYPGTEYAMKAQERLRELEPGQ